MMLDDDFWPRDYRLSLGDYRYGIPLLGGSSQDLYKWLITMVSCCPVRMRYLLPNGLNGLQMGVTYHFLTGMVLQVGNYL